MPSVALLSLLGAAALAGVRSAPVEKDDHVEEMVTRCIVEVLLNGLSKPNAPPINPLCKEFLKKSSQQKPEEKRVGQDAELNTRPSSESKELERPPERIVQEQLNEGEFKRQGNRGEKWHPEEGKHEEKDGQQVASLGNLYSYDDEAHKEEKRNEEEKGENGNYPRNYHSKEGSRENKHNEEVKDVPLDKKSLSSVGRVAESDYKHSVDLKDSEEIVHSQEKGKQESKEEEKEEEEEESSEKYHRNFHREYEDSYEKEAEAEKQGHKPRQNYQKSKLGRHHHNGEKRDSPEESSEEEDDFWDKRSHWPKHYYETGHHYEEKRNSEEMHGSEEMEEGDRSQESFQRKRSHDKLQKQARHHYEEKRNSEETHGSEEMEEGDRSQESFQRKRSHDKLQKQARHHYEEKRNSEEMHGFEEMEEGDRSQESFPRKRSHDQPQKEARYHYEEKRNSEEMEGDRSQESFQRKRSHDKLQKEARHHYEEKRNSEETHGFEEMEEGDRSQESFQRKRSHDKPQKEARHHYEENKNSEETHISKEMEEGDRSQESFQRKRSHDELQKETRQNYEEKRNSQETHGSEEMEEGDRSQESFQRKRSHDKPQKEARYHYEEKRNSEEMHASEEMEEGDRSQESFQRKRSPDKPQKEARHNYEERKPLSKASKEYAGEQHSYRGLDEKRHLDSEWPHLHMAEIPRLPSTDMEEREKFYIPEEEEKRHYPSILEEELEKGHQSEGKKHKRTFLVEEGYPRSHYLIQNVKRAAASYIPYYQQLRWKNRHAEKKDNMADLFLESEEEPRSYLDERDFFPDYNDYEPWERKQLMDSLNHKHSENGRREKTHKFDVKREYNRMDELAHLLSNRKKSAEFPELYSSKEDVKRRHMRTSNEGKLGQRPLTLEEEKELENLAAMDLELQKIAGKFSNHHQG